jgi:hypothetical protein
VKSENISLTPGSSDDSASSPLKVLTIVDSMTIRYPLDEAPEEDIKNYFDYYTQGHYLRTVGKESDIDVHPLVITDSKPYWRKAMDGDYKANRPQRTLKSPLPLSGVVSLDNWEADDIAATVVINWLAANDLIELPNLCPDFTHLVGEYDEIHLCTVDTDWLQLCVVPEIHWFCVRGFQPSHRTLSNIGEWLEKKKKRWTKKQKKDEVLIDSAVTDSPVPGSSWEPNIADKIRVMKWIHGDKSDNVLPGAEQYMTDLFQIPYGSITSTKNVMELQKGLKRSLKEFNPVDYGKDYLIKCAINSYTPTPDYNR